MELRLVLTEDCIFNCYFCLNEYSGPRSTRSDLQIDELIFFIDFFCKTYPPVRITITGGEPLLYKDFPQLCDFLKQIDSHLTLVSNGYLIDKYLNYLDMFNEFHISFHSFSKKGWQEITGTKSTQKIVISNIINLRKHNPGKKIFLNVVAEENNNNIEEIKKYLEFAHKYSLRINVFKEGYLDAAKRLGLKNIIYKKPAQLWNLDFFNPSLVTEKIRKKIFGARC